MTIAAIEAAIAEPDAGDRRPPGGPVPSSGTPVPSRGSPESEQSSAAPDGRLGRRSSLADEAAVALVFAGRDGDLRLCFIRRATDPRDPWSGQMALPGGRATPADASLCAAAVRETHEEVGLSLARARYLGALPPIPLVRHGRPTTGSVAPFVFYAGGALPALTVDPVEVAAGYWIAVRHLRDPGQRAVMQVTGGGVTRRLPAVRFGRHLIWGMTYRIVIALLDGAARS